MSTTTTTDIVSVNRLRGLKRAGCALIVVLITIIPEFILASKIDDWNAYVEQAEKLGNQIFQLPFGLWSGHTVVAFVENTPIVVGYNFFVTVWGGSAMGSLLFLALFCWEAVSGEVLF